MNQTKLALQLSVMLNLQDELNKKIHPEWHAQNFAWHRAIMDEVKEFMDHHGWKWWKKQFPDMAQCRLELIDIWHFLMSQHIQIVRSDKNIVSDGIFKDYLQNAIVVQEVFASDNENADVLLMLDHLAVRSIDAGILDGNKLTSNLTAVGYFVRIMNALELSFDDLYRFYVGKNVLNTFRQDHGYKTGEYQKNWADGREDNEHLTDILSALDIEDPDYKDRVYEALLSEYPGDKASSLRMN